MSSIMEFWGQMVANPLLFIAVALTMGVILVNGWTDAPNAIATCVVTRCMPPKAAILMAAVFNFLGVFIMTLINSTVAETITKMVDFGSDPKLAIIALSVALFAIVLWATLAWIFGIPTSESHALIAGLTGSAIALHGNFEAVNGQEWIKVIYGIFISVLLGFGLGWIVCKVVTMLSEKAPYGMISFGGNVGVWGQKPTGGAWEIGIKDPFDTEGVVGKIRTDGGFVSVSGDYERFFEVDGKKYHHIFDPKTGYPVDNGLRSVAVYTKDAALGDALSTALFVMGYDKAMEFYNSGIYDFEALFITDNEILMTKGMEEMFTYEN